MKKIALLGGSFSPPGLHHRRIVEGLAASHQFDEILVIPCGGRPDKPSLNDVASIHRAAMADLAFGRIQGVKVLLFDLENDTYTPTCDLQEMFGADAEVWHVVGADLVIGGGKGESQIQASWKNGREIWDSLNFFIIHRAGFDLRPEDLPPRHREFDGSRYFGASTIIRENIFRGESVDGLLMPEVADYIRRYDLYKGAEPRLVHNVSLAHIKFLFAIDEQNSEAVADAAMLRAKGLEDEVSPQAILVFGGDGTMLRAVRAHWRKRLPFVGINYGHRGFLLNRFFPNVHHQLTAYCMPLLYVEARGKDGAGRNGIAFNDAYVERAGESAAWVEVKVNGRVVAEKLVCDGVLVGTPSGSTAYARAMGAQPVPITARTILLVGSNILDPFGWKMSYLPIDAEIELHALFPEHRPLKGIVDGVSLGEVTSLKARVSRIAAVELVFDPREDIQRKLLDTQFPNREGGAR